VQDRDVRRDFTVPVATYPGTLNPHSYKIRKLLTPLESALTKVYENKGL